MEKISGLSEIIKLGFEPVYDENDGSFTIQHCSGITMEQIEEEHTIKVNKMKDFDIGNGLTFKENMKLIRNMNSNNKTVQALVNIIEGQEELLQENEEIMESNIKAMEQKDVFIKELIERLKK